MSRLSINQATQRIILKIVGFLASTAFNKPEFSCHVMFCFLYFSVRTELLEQGAISRLAISQADIRHSGVYTCAVSDNISQSLRLHIIDGKSPRHIYCRVMHFENTLSKNCLEFFWNIKHKI